MSKDSSPGHQFSGVSDSFYEPDYALQISAQMQVPDKITFIDRSEASENSVPLFQSGKIMMHVPERILVAGGDEHIECREPLPELRLESSFSPPPSTGIVLTAPPRVLTVDEYHYPVVEETQKIQKKIVKHPPQQTMNGITDKHESKASTSHHPEDEEVVILRKQIRLLNRRVASLEQASQLQQQREIILYSVGVIYFVIKGVIWLHRHF